MKDYSSIEYNQVLADVTSLLPQAIVGTNPKVALAQKSEEEKAALVRSLNEYLTGHSPAIEQPTADDFTIAKLDNLPVNYDVIVSKAIRPGKYDYRNKEVNQKHFPTERSGKADVKMGLFHFGKNMSYEAVIKAMNKAGYRPAELLELLAIGASSKYRDLQKEFSIIAMGSAWRNSDGNRYVPYLSRSGPERYLHLDWLVRTWHGSCRFAGVRK